MHSPPMQSHINTDLPDRHDGPSFPSYCSSELLHLSTVAISDLYLVKQTSNIRCKQIIVYAVSRLAYIILSR